MTERIAALFTLALIAVACGTSVPGSPTPSPTVRASPSPSPSLSATPTATPAARLYLRAWQTQALPPPSNYMTAPMLTVSNGILIDNNVAIPLIFPGPLLILPNASPLSEQGDQVIVDQARDLGLLDGPTDFTGGGVTPGGVAGNLLLVINGTSYELSGNPAALRMCNDRPCQVDPGTPEAFAAFWWLMQNPTAWLGGNLGQSEQYDPERLLVLVVPPAAGGDIPTNQVTWPLADFADMGVTVDGAQGTSCATVFGADLDDLLPALLNANQMTVFIDNTGADQSVNARALVPLEPSPCADQS
jgi:hypothetical protein